MEEVENNPSNEENEQEDNLKPSNTIINENISESINTPNLTPKYSIISLKTYSKKLIEAYIVILRSMGFSYGQIEKLSKINKSQIFEIEKGTWYPKKPGIEETILAKLSKLIKINIISPL